ncbi:MAG: DUF4159 domain-containing protein [Balneolaceae bacterium]
MKYFVIFIAALSFTAGDFILHAQDNGEFKIARIQYSGGGDWYNDPSALTNLIRFTRQHVPVTISDSYDDVQIGSRDLFNYPFAFLTGHGTIATTQSEIENMRNWLDNGGFLYIDDDYGLDEYARRLIKNLYPESELIELPFTHAIYNQVFEIKDGLPKVHEHNGLPPQGLAVFHEGRMVIFYTYESNLADAWTNPEVHNPPPALREKALRMGANILVYALTAI